MDDVEKLKEAYSKILTMYSEAGIIKEVRWGYTLNEDKKLEVFYLFIIPQNEQILEQLFIEDIDCTTYPEVLESVLIEHILIIDSDYYNKINIMVEGSGNTFFDPNDLKILEVRRC